MDQPSRLLSAIVDIPERTIRTWVYKRKIPYYKIGKLVRFDLVKIRNWYSANSIKPIERGVLYDAQV